MASPALELAKSLLRPDAGARASHQLPPDLGCLQRAGRQASTGDTGGPRLERAPPPLRYAPSLQVPQGLLVGFLTGGYGFDDTSVAEAVRQANAHFAKRELSKAADVCAAAYEIGRLHYDYRPLMHDLLIRRVLCHSMMGDAKKGLNECDLALRIVPNSATAFLLKGVLHSKLGSAEEANECFQQAVRQSRELRDVVDCLVALFVLGQGQCDRAIQITTRVLERSGHPFALLVRGDAHKFHPSGYFSDRATADYAALLDVDMSLQGLVGERYSPAQHARADELLLRFHPRLLAEGPLPYDKYPMHGKRQPLLTMALVLTAVAKLKTWVKSTKLVENVEQKAEELLRQRAAAEHRMVRLFEAQQKLAGLKSHAEVWGPADPDHSRVRKYRRYWMERPLNFPQRDSSQAAAKSRSTSPHASPARSTSRPTTASRKPRTRSTSPCNTAGRQYEARDELFDRIDVDGDGVISREEFNRFVLEASAPSPYAQREQPPDRGAAAAIATLPPFSQALAAPAAPVTCEATHLPAELQPRQPPNLGRPPEVRPAAVAGTGSSEGPAATGSGLPTPGGCPAVLSPRATGSSDTGRAGGGHGIACSQGGAAAAASCKGFVAEPGPSAPEKPKFGATSSAMDIAARLAKDLPAQPAEPPPEKLGCDWSQQQWLAKALQLAEKYAGDSGGLPEASPRHSPAGPSRAAAEPRVPATATAVRLPVAPGPGPTSSTAGVCGSPRSRQGSGGRLQRSASGASAEALEEEPSGFQGVHRPGVPPGERVEVNLVEAIEQYGFDVLPEWYEGLDKIYEITDMKHFDAEPANPAVPVPGIVGAPGYSYVVPKSPRKRNKSTLATPVLRPSEATARRYHSRLVATKLPVSRAASREVFAPMSART